MKVSKRINIRYIFIMLAFLSISFGLWKNFRLLWIESNGVEISDISKMISMGALFTCVTIFFTTMKVPIQWIKKLLFYSIFLKLIMMILLFIGNQMLDVKPIASLIIFDVVLDNIIALSIYPLLSTITKKDRLYSKRKLIEYIFRDVGVFIGGFLIGKTLSGVLVDYNICLMIAIFFLLISFFVLFLIKLPDDIEEEEEPETSNLRAFFNYVKDKKVFLFYFLYTFIGNTSYNIGLGMQMLVMTNLLSFSSGNATYFFLIVGICADIFGVLALWKLTPKSDYLSVFFKFGVRMIGYTLIFLTNNPAVAVAAIFVSLFVSTAFENRTDGVYINLVETKYQLSFANIHYLVARLGESLGLFLVGILFSYGLYAIYGVAAAIGFGQVGLGFYLVWLRKKKAL